MIIHWAFCCDPDDFGWEGGKAGQLSTKKTQDWIFCVSYLRQRVRADYDNPFGYGTSRTHLARPPVRPPKAVGSLRRGLAWLSLESGSRPH